MISTIKQNKYFTPYRKLKESIRRKTDKNNQVDEQYQFKSYIGTNFIENFGIAVNYINRAELIYGTPTELLQGK